MKLFCIYIQFTSIDYDKYFSHVDISGYHFKANPPSTWYGGGRYYGLYACTTNKNYAIKFMKERKRSHLFTMKVRYTTKEEFQEFSKSPTYTDHELKVRTLEVGMHPDGTEKTYCDILCTTSEFREAMYLDTGNLFDQGFSILTAHLNDISDWYPLKDKYITALDSIWYTTMYDLAFGAHPNFDPEIQEDRIEGTSAMLSYDSSLFGNSFLRWTDADISEYTRFWLLFGRTFWDGGDSDDRP